ncbi:MAG TPA: hypothetical protein PLX03_03455, partial [Candidatus Hydrogenedentes bacterium]|nr:hypothetical protein [Candidatus Hydrogenedentota bacterium]
MKLLHVYKDFDPPVKGGIEGHIALMCRYQRSWANVEALVCGGGLFRTVREERNGIPVTAAAEWGRLMGAPVAPGFPRLIMSHPGVQPDAPGSPSERGWDVSRRIECPGGGTVGSPAS